MATKVFLRFNRDIRDVYVKGREYEVLQRTDGLIRAKSELGIEFFDFETNKKYFDVIEREDSTTFEANCHTWTRHTPGEPMPCDGDAYIDAICDNGCILDGMQAKDWVWDCNIIGWRFADSAKPEQIERPITGIIKRVCAEHSDADAKAYITNLGAAISMAGRVAGKAFVDELYPQDESERNDLIAAVDDGHLTPGQKAYIQGKEDAQAAKQQLAKDAQDKALQDRAGQLADAGKAMDVVRDGFTHKLGWSA